MSRIVLIIINTKIMIESIIMMLTYVGLITLNNYIHRRAVKRLNKMHLYEIKRTYEEVDVIMINALKVTIQNCVLREDYEQAQAAKDMLSRYEKNEWHKPENKNS